MSYIYIFSAVALLVLCIACINYMNMATARAAGRTKEIGVRKAAGARSGNLIGQFLVESLLIAFLSLLFAVLAVNIALPSFNVFTGKSLSLGFSTEAFIWLGVGVATLLVGLLSGSYPAFYLSRLAPFTALRQANHSSRRGLSIRQTLVVFQFALSIVMIAATLVVYRQMQYVRNKNLGFNQELLVVVDINSGLVRRSFETIKNEYTKLSGVKDVTVSSRVPGDWKTVPQVGILAPGKRSTREATSYFLGVDRHFLRTYGVKLLKGRNFNEGTADSTSAIINRTAAKSLGISEPGEQWLEIGSVSFNGDGTKLEKPIKVQVIGITEDFHFQSLRETVGPMVLGNWKNPLHNIDYFTVRVTGTNVPQTLSALEGVLRQIDPDHLFEYHFLDQQWALLYEEDQRRERIFAAAALAAILIACMGIFGLAAYTAQQRTKEIGIRKVLGASVAGITVLLSKDFLKLVLLANLFAWPVAWYASGRWLAGFAYRIEVGWGLFALAGVLALLIALATVGYQSVKAALTDPVTSLRNE
jgi:putative ABC transport system permease protein